MTFLKTTSFLTILTSEMESAGINKSPYQLLPCFIHKLLRYSILKLITFRQKGPDFNSVTSLFVTSVQISEFYLVCGIFLS